MATSAEHLILRGLSVLIRGSFSPNNAEAQARHFKQLTDDIGPWLTDYAAEIAKPTTEAVAADQAELSLKLASIDCAVHGDDYLPSMAKG